MNHLLRILLLAFVVVCTSAYASPSQDSDASEELTIREIHTYIEEKLSDVEGFNKIAKSELPLFQGFSSTVLLEGSETEKDYFFQIAFALYNNSPVEGVILMMGIPDYEISLMSEPLRIKRLKFLGIFFESLGLRAYAENMLDSAITLAIHGGQHQLAALYSHLAYHYSSQSNTLLRPIDESDSLLLKQVILATRLCKVEAKKKGEQDLFDYAEANLLLYTVHDSKQFIDEYGQVLARSEQRVRSDVDHVYHKLGFDPWLSLEYVEKLNVLEDYRTAQEYMDQTFSSENLDQIKDVHFAPLYGIEKAISYLGMSDTIAAQSTLTTVLSKISDDRQHKRYRPVLMKAISMYEEMGDSGKALDLMRGIVKKDEELRSIQENRIAEIVNWQNKEEHHGMNCADMEADYTNRLRLYMVLSLVAIVGVYFLARRSRQKAIESL